MNFKKVFTYSVLFIFASAMFYLSWIYGLLEFILSLCIYTLIFYFFHFIWIKIRQKQLMYFSDFIDHFLNRISIFMIIITSIIWWFAYYMNEINPAKMPEFSLSNWTKIVKFQAMSHIWSVNFYEQIAKNITLFKENLWWVYFFEWVKPWTDENLEKFNNAIWIQFDQDLYKNFSKLYWVTNQDNSKFLWLVNNLDFNVDLNMDEIVSEYEKKLETKPEQEKKFKSKLPIDANKTIIDSLSKLNDRQLKVLVYINKAILNFIIWSDNAQSFLTDNFTNKDLFEVILDKRNIVLSEAIINSKYDNIYITYWLLHFKWVFDLLQKNDPNWKIVSTNYLHPIE